MQLPLDSLQQTDTYQTLKATQLTKQNNTNCYLPDLLFVACEVEGPGNGICIHTPDVPVFRKLGSGDYQSCRFRSATLFYYYTELQFSMFDIWGGSGIRSGELFVHCCQD